MTKLSRAVVVNAPAENVFRVLEDLDALPLLYNCVCNVSDVRRTSVHVGDAFRGTFSVVGLQFDVAFTRTEIAPPVKLVDRFEGAMNGVMAFGLEPRGAATRVSLDVDYEISRGLLGRIVNRILFVQVAEKNAERVLENLALVVESTGAVPGTATADLS